MQKIEDIHGNTLCSDPQMLTYLKQFEQSFAESDRHIIDATEGGAKIAWTEIMPLRDVIDRFCTREIPQEILNLPETTPFTPPDPELVATAIETRMDEASQVRELYERTLKLLHSIQSSFDKRAFVSKTIRKIEHMKREVAKHADLNQMVSEVAQWAELRKQRTDLRIAAKGTKGIERQKAQLDRDIAYVSELISGCHILTAMLKHAIEHESLMLLMFRKRLLDQRVKIQLPVR